MRQLDIFGKAIEASDVEVKKGNTKAGEQLQAETPLDPKTANINNPPRSLTQFTDNDNESRIQQAKERIKQQLQKELLKAKKKAEELEVQPASKRGRKSLKKQPDELKMLEIPDDDVLFQKQYYSISEVAAWFKVNPSLIRFWENEFDVLQPRKTRKGSRLFRPEDVKNLQLIYHLVREKKYTLEGAKEYIKSNKQRVQMQVQLTQALQKFKGFLLELKANLQA